MSKEMQSWTPVDSAICNVAMTPAAGPDSAVYTGCSTATSAPMIPPLDFMIENAAPVPKERRDCFRLSMYVLTRGVTYALRTVVMVRSYSRYTGNTSDDRETATLGSSCNRISLARRSLVGLA